jgi:hypothetical protein
MRKPNRIRPEFRALSDVDPYGDPAVLIHADQFFLFLTEVGYTCTQDERGVLRIMPQKRLGGSWLNRSQSCPTSRLRNQYSLPQKFSQQQKANVTRQPWGCSRNTFTPKPESRGGSVEN